MAEHFPRLLIITGAMAAGKSTIAEAVARRLPRSVHLRGGLFRRMIVSGRAELTPDPTPEALRQLDLRYDLACAVAERYLDAGFTVVYQDILLEQDLKDMVSRLAAWQPGVVVLVPSAVTLRGRDRDRVKTGYHSEWTPEMLVSSVLERTLRYGLWIDNSEHSVTETVDVICANTAALRDGLSAPVAKG
jgi:predicted kinase